MRIIKIAAEPKPTRCRRCGTPLQNHPDKTGHEDVKQCPKCFLDHSPHAQSGQSANYDPDTGKVTTGPTNKVFPRWQ